jgi:O-antigen ligase
LNLERWTLSSTLPVAAVGAGLCLILWGPGLALAGIGAILYLAGAAIAPRVGLGALVGSLPLYLIPRQIGGLAISPPEATLLLSAVAVAGRAIVGRWRGRRDPSAIRPSPYDGAIALFLASALLSLLVTEYLRLSLRELRTLVVEPVVFFYLVRHVVRSIEEVGAIVDVLLAAVTVVALLGVGQFFLGGAVTDVQGVRRVQGTYSSPNHLGLLLGRAIPFLLAGAWLLPRQRVPRLGAAALCAVALGLSFSLGGWLGTLAATLTLAGLLGGRRALAVVVVVSVVLGLLALPVLRVERVLAHLDPTQGTTFVRLQLWQASLELLAEHPILGIGLDNFLYRYPLHIPSGIVMEPNLSHPHNLVLQFWLQLGLPGLAALLWLLAAFGREAIRRVGPDRPAAERALAAGALGSMVDFAVHGSIDNSYFLVDMAFIFWLTLAVGTTPASRALSAVSHSPSAVGDSRP